MNGWVECENRRQEPGSVSDSGESKGFPVYMWHSLKPQKQTAARLHGCNGYMIIRVGGSTEIL